MSTENPPTVPGLVDDNLLSEMERSFTAFIQLLQSKSKVVEHPDDLPPGVPTPQAGMFWLGFKSPLGETKMSDRGKVQFSFFDAVACHGRPHAHKMEGARITQQTFRKDDLYLTLKDTESKWPEYSIRVGIDILFWLPEKEQFATYFFYGSAQDAGVQCYRRRLGSEKPTFLRITSNYVKWKRGDFWAPIVSMSSESSLEPPAKDAFDRAVKSFLDQVPKIEEPSEVPDDGIDR